MSKRDPIVTVCRLFEQCSLEEQRTLLKVWGARVKEQTSSSGSSRVKRPAATSVKHPPASA